METSEPGEPSDDANSQMTTEVAAGAEDCFFLPEVKVGQSIELEYQVRVSLPWGNVLFHPTMAEVGMSSFEQSLENT